MRQITTGTECHLDAEMIGRALEDWRPSDLEVHQLAIAAHASAPAPAAAV